MPTEYCAVPGCWGSSTRPGCICTKHYRYRTIANALLIGAVVVSFLLAIAVVWETFNP